MQLKVFLQLQAKVFSALHKKLSANNFSFKIALVAKSFPKAFLLNMNVSK